MFKYGIVETNFKGFMVNNVKPNYNVVKIVYRFKDPIVSMVDKLKENYKKITTICNYIIVAKDICY
jgi:hypothetical protein